MRQAITAAITTILATLAFAPVASAAGIHDFDVSYEQAGGAPAALAGSHDFDLTTKFSIDTAIDPEIGEVPQASLRNLTVRLPAGLAGNPTATPRCRTADFADISPLEPKLPACANDTVVGVATLRVRLLQTVDYVASPVYNLEQSPGAPARLGLVVAGVPVTMTAGINPKAPNNVEAIVTEASQAVPVYGGVVTVWGDPASSLHDSIRGTCLNVSAKNPTPVPQSTGDTCPVDPDGFKAFLSMPTSCAAPSSASFQADFWQLPGFLVGGSALTELQPEDCASLDFAPQTRVTPTTTAADSPTGLETEITVPTEGVLDPQDRSPSAIEKAVVQLPEGVTTNAAAANGLEGCSLGQFEATALEPGSGCPQASKIGSLEVETPLLEGSTLPGSVYVATPHDNPFDSLIALYLVIRDPDLGILITQAGKVEPDPGTGQLSATFDGLPQLPFSNLVLKLRSGQRAPLTTPPTCGTYTTQIMLYPYAQGLPPVHNQSSFEVSGGPCAADPSQLPNGLGFSAGTLDDRAASYSPFALRVSRPDGSQPLAAISATLPKGLVGKLAGIPYCSEAALAAAAARSGEGQGAAELASPSCPLASEVGRVTVGAGAGSEPLYVSGRAYLAGPYKSAPLSLVIVTPAIAGPFDLGTVVVRTALRVDPKTAQITAVSDPIPQILHGLPLGVRSVSVDMSRPSFTLNPSSCEPASITGSATSALGATTLLSQYFQASGCGRLKFKPKLALALKGATRRSGHPALRAVVTFPKKGEFANIAGARVGLPHSEFLDQGNIGTVCTQPQLQASACPKASVYGHARAWTPLLDKPLEGPVYLGVGYGHQLPDLVADLGGQIRVLLNGKVDTTPRKGLRNSFEAVPDAPVTKFVLEMKGGKRKGLLVNSENICQKPQRASARFTGHDGSVSSQQVRIANDCKGAKKKHPGKHRKDGKQGGQGR